MTNHTPTTLNTSVFLDSSLPNTARIFDYLAGGNANFQADRQAADEMLKIMPSLRKWVQLRRAFVQEAAYRLHASSFNQFLDLGSGMPADDHIHAFAPQARILYSDINPVAVSYGSSLFSDLDHVDYVRGDAKSIHELVHSKEARTLLHLDEKVAIGLNGLILFLTAKENKKLAQYLYEWAPENSIIFVVLQTRNVEDLPESYDAFVEITRSAFLPINLYTLEENLEMLLPWKPLLLEPITNFLGLPDNYITEDEQEGIGMAFYAAILEK